MGPFDRVPNEILTLIFAKESEPDERPWSYDAGPHLSLPRRMKDIPRRARQVCALWKSLIDNYTSPNFSFWSTTLHLNFMKVTVPNIPEYPKPRRVLYPRQMARFRRQLLHSEGCDLNVVLQFVPEDIDTEGSYAVIQLLLHAMDMLAPYQSQIALTRLYTNSQLASTYLLGLITSHWVDLPRLQTITFDFTNPNSLGPLSSTESDLIYSRNFDTLQTSRSIHICWPMSMGHLRHLDTLCLASSTWLNGDLIVPCTLSHLEVQISETHTLLDIYLYLRSHPLLCNNIRSIYATRWDLTEPYSRLESAEIPGEGGLPISCSSLRYLALESINRAEADLFLRNLIYPKLERLELRLDTELQPDHNEVDYDLRWPNLREVELIIPYTLASLSFLRLFPAVTVKTLALSFQSDLSSDLDQVETRFRAVISNLHLKYFCLDSAPFRHVWAILNWLDCRCLEILAFSFMWNQDQDSTLPAYYPQLVTPKLKHLSLTTEDMVGLNHILNHLQGADGLETFDITMYIYEDQVSGYNLDPVRSLFARLASIASDKGEVLFPRLQEFDFSAHLPVGPADETSKVDDAPLNASSTWVLNESQQLEVSELVTHLLRTRANAGAVPLGLEGQLVSFPGDWVNEMIDFKARAGLTTRVQEME